MSVASTFTLSGDREDGRIFIVDMYRKVWLACPRILIREANEPSGRVSLNDYLG